MKKLNRMLVREILKSKKQFLAVAAIIFAGISIFSSTYMSYQNLNTSVDLYYDEHSFLDYYAEANNITPQVIEKVKKIEGVKECIGRISQDIGADMGEDRRVILRLISLPDRSPPLINRINLISGKYFSKTEENVSLVNKKFAEFYRLSEGSTIKIIVNNRIQDFKVSGIAESPEFLYTIKSNASVFPSAEDFGILFVKESVARNILGYNSSYNQLHVIFDEGIDTDEVIDTIEKTLNPYGFKRGVERKDQLSNVMVQDDIDMLETVAYMFPILFLTVAAMIIYVVQKRLVYSQRTSIGVMKAFGYTDKRILLHYMMYSLIISILGVLPSAIAGYYLSIALTSSYNKIYSLQTMSYNMNWNALIIGAVLSTVFCLLAGYNSAKYVLNIGLVEAMRAEAPKSGKRIFLQRIGFIWNKLSFSWKMSTRNLFRNKQRTIVTIFGFSFTIMLFIVSISFADSINWILYQHFFEHQRQDYRLVFSEPASIYDVLELDHIDGIKTVEPIMQIPFVMKKGWREEEAPIIGLMDNDSLYRLQGEKQIPIRLSKKGLVIAEELAKRIGAEEGDIISIKPLYGNLEEKEIRISGFIKQYTGFSSYMNMDELARILDDGRFANAALINVREDKEKSVKEKLLKNRNIETIEKRLNDYRNFEEQLLYIIYAFIAFMIIFGSIMGFAITFNITMINITERTRELASLKVLGYFDKEVNSLVLRENIFLGILSIGPGAALGWIISRLFADIFSNDLFTLETKVYSRTYIIAFVSIFILIHLAQWMNRGNIYELDMVEVLKNREG